MSWLRTSFSIERTLMAWMRTTAAMIGFGFTIVEFFSRISWMGELAPARSPYVPLILGVLLVGAGVVALAIAFAQYLRALRFIESDMFAEIAERPRNKTAAWVAAGAIEAAGIVALGSIIIRALL